MLFGQNKEKPVEELALVEVGQVGNVDVFHTAEKLNLNGVRLPKANRAGNLNSRPGR